MILKSRDILPYLAVGLSSCRIKATLALITGSVADSYADNLFEYS
jgi:hypothetical protein